MQGDHFFFRPIMPILKAGKILTTMENNQSSSSTQSPVVNNDINRKRQANSPASLATVDEKNANNTALAKGINAIVEKLGNIEISIGSNNSMLTNLTAKSQRTDHAIHQLTASTNFLQQSRLNGTIEISGYPVTLRSKSGDVRHHVKSFLNELGIEVDVIEIATAYFRDFKSNGSDKSILVIVFIHEAVKSRVMKSKMQSKSNGSQNLYFNEALTSFNRSLIFKARQLKKAGKFSNVGSMNGQIFVKKSNDSQKIFINNLCEMEEISALSAQQISERVKSSKIKE